MNYITEKEFEQKLKQLQQHNLSKERELKLIEEKNKYRKDIKLPSTSKLMAVYLFIILNVVLIFAMRAMWHFADLSFLGVLITDVAGQVIVYMIYALKSKAENTSGGIVYETTLAKMQMIYGENSGSKMSTYEGKETDNSNNNVVG